MKKRNVILEGQREDDTNSLFDAREKNKAYETQIKEFETLNAKLAEKVKTQKSIINNLEDLPGGSHPDDEKEPTN
jgi:predicted RNase H-like nuclease (RuvC/YqgF family)